MKKYFEPKHQGPRTMTTFQIDKDLWTDFKVLMARENRPAGNALTEMIEKYLKEHGDGNPQFTLEQFEDPNFIACPAFYRDGLAWESYMKQATPEELSKIRDQVVLIDKKLGRHI